ncbi:hypothetical protein [Diplocloster agilis]|uniref:hypothetical protein n=1 Tax=Diplocloster agilis TaxID=2850323 RepID=UPI0023AAFC6B|nr:hypothetical protein [Diplocloster agilis]
MSTSVELKRFAAQIRMETVKCLIHRGFGHIGGCLSIADVLAALYGKLMHVDPADPHAKERDYLVVSKGHAGPAVFATLALKGYFPLDWMDTLCVGGTRLPSHCDRIQTPGIDVSTGSLGQGLSAAFRFKACRIMYTVSLETGNCRRDRYGKRRYTHISTS